MATTLIHGGTVVNADGAVQADVLLYRDRIAAVGAELRTPADRVIDATGRLVVPGAVDVHTHFALAAGALVTADDFTTGTIAAACGGTTTVLDFVTPTPGGSLIEAFEARLAEADGRAAVDFGLHVVLRELGPSTASEMAAVIARGVGSFKLFTAYPGRYMLGDGDLLAVLQHCAELGALAMAHAENGAVIELLVAQARAAGRREPIWHARTRPPGLEAEAVHRCLMLAALAGARLHVVHLSTAAALGEVARARGRGQDVSAETCPQYLLLDERAYADDGQQAARLVMSPPLRAESDRAALWSGLATAEIDLVATDHCAFTAAQKRAGEGDFTLVPNGVPGVETRLGLLFDAGVAAGRLTLQRWVELCCTAPAQRFGLTRKGVVAPGADADLVIFDPTAEHVLGAATQATALDWCPYEGRRVRGACEMVLARGEVVAEQGRFCGHAGAGRFLPVPPVPRLDTVTELRPRAVEP